MRLARRLVLTAVFFAGAVSRPAVASQETATAAGAGVAPAAQMAATAADSVPPTPVRALVRRGDEAMARLEPHAAFAGYQAAVTADPNDYEALWKAGRTLIDIAELERRSDSQKDKYNKALKYAERAIHVRPDGAEGHYVRAYALGRVGLFEGGKTKLRLAREVRSEALRATDLDPLLDGAYNVLGAWNYDLADFGFLRRTLSNVLLGGVPDDVSFENAAHYYELAIQANPEHIDHHLQYARTLLKLDREEEARAELQKVLDLPARDLDDGAHKQAAEKLLEDLD